MAIRQYVGARYVPRFMGTLDPTQQYEALDVVDNGSGTSYIARKIVPPGTPLTDSEYWFLYGASSGAIIQLQNDMLQAQSDISDLQADIPRLEDEMDTPLSERVFLFMADSYQVQTEYLNFAADFIKCKSYIIKAYTGAGFYKHNSAYDSYTFKNILQTIDPLTAAEKLEITDVAFCVACGNDNTVADSDLTNAMADIDTYLRAQLPNLRNIRLYAMGWATNDAAVQAQILRNCDIYMRMTAYLNWKYADCTRVLKSGVWMNTSDTMGYHPAVNSRYQLAYAVAGAIISGSCQYTWNEDMEADFNITLPGSWSGASIYRPSDEVLKMQVRISNNGDIIINQNDFPIRIDGATIGANNAYYDIGLTPTQANKNPIPIGGMFPVYGYGTTFILQSAMIMRPAANDTKIRIFTWAPSATTGNVHIFTTPQKIL